MPEGSSTRSRRGTSPTARLSDGDPSVRAGRLAYDVMEWWVGAGTLAFAGAGGPVGERREMPVSRTVGTNVTYQHSIPPLHTARGYSEQLELHDLGPNDRSPKAGSADASRVE